MKLLIAQTAGLIALCVVAVFAAAEPLSIKLPTETAKLRPSSLPGYALATQKCQICHSVDYIEYQPPGMIESQWVAEVRKMQHAYAAPITEHLTKRTGNPDITLSGSCQCPTLLAFMETPIFCFFAPSMFAGHCSIQQ